MNKKKEFKISQKNFHLRRLVPEGADAYLSPQQKIYKINILKQMHFIILLLKHIAHKKRLLPSDYFIILLKI